MSEIIPLIMPVIDRLRMLTRLPVSAAFSLGDAMARGSAGDELFVYLLSESAEAEREVQGTAARHVQRVSSTIAVVARISASAAARDAPMDASEERRAQLLEILSGWRIPGSERNLAYVSFVIATIQQGSLWQEMQFTTRWRLVQEIVA